MSQATSQSKTVTDSFKAQADKLRDDFLATQSEQTQHTVMQAMQELVAAQLDKDAKTTGDQIPDFELDDAQGNRVRIRERLAQGPLVISFYRGGWCPFCNLEFKALHDILPRIKAHGAQLIGISPETPESIAETVSQHGVQFDVLSDAGNRVAKAFGLIMYVPEPMRPLYAQWGMDVPAANGDDSWALPIPATYVVDRDGRIRAHYVNVDYTQRMEPADILDALNEIEK